MLSAINVPKEASPPSWQSGPKCFVSSLKTTSTSRLPSLLTVSKIINQEDDRIVKIPPFFRSERRDCIIDYVGHLKAGQLRSKTGGVIIVY